MILKIVRSGFILAFIFFMLVGCRFENEKLVTEIKELDVQISNLPIPKIASPFWTLGCKSTGSPFPDTPIEILINLPKPRKVDAVVLMPALHDINHTYEVYGFPKKFIIELLHSDGTRTCIADYSQTEYLEPKLSPQWFRSNSTKKTQTIRIYATELRYDPTWEERGYILALSECYAFSGAENVALNAEVKSNGEYRRYMMWQSQNLVDGFTYYSPLEHYADNPIVDLNVHSPNGKIDLYIDLKKTRRITELHFWPLALSPHEGHALLNTQGFPRYIHVRIANKPDYSDAINLYKTNDLLQAPGVGPLMRRVGPQSGRYIWLTLGESLPNFLGPLNRIALAEFMCLSHGHPVTIGTKVSWASDVQMHRDFIPNRLVNRHTPQGKILDLREWLEQLDLRDKLLQKKVNIAKQLEDLNQRNNLLLRVASYLAVLGVFALIAIAVSTRQREKLRIQKMRDQIASDLHDEVGANLSSIKGNAELLKAISKFENPDQIRIIEEIINNSKQTATETRMLIRFLERDKFPEEILTAMQKTAAKMLSDISCQFEFEKDLGLQKINPNMKWDIFFFFKETIHNIVKHSNSKNVHISLKRNSNFIELSIQDDGVGIQELNELTLSHLKNRASKIKGDMVVESKKGYGTKVTLVLKLV